MFRKSIRYYSLFVSYLIVARFLRAEVRYSSILHQMIMRVLLFLLMLLSVPVGMEGQRVFKPVKLALKAKNYKDALTQINTLRQDSLYRDSPKLCEYSIEANRGLNDIENMKLYLRKDYDTVAFFSTTLQIIREAARLDSIDQARLAEKGGKPKYRSQVGEILSQYVPNLRAASHFFYQRGKFVDALSYLRASLDLPHSDIGQYAKLDTRNDTLNATLYLMSAFYAKQYAEVHRYESLALKDKAARPVIFESLIQTAVAEKDTAAHHRLLEEAFKEYPLHASFFTRLADYYTGLQDYASVLRMANITIGKDSQNVFALVAKCIALQNLQRYDECITTAESLLRADTLSAEANYYLGASYVAKASAILLPENALSGGYKTAKSEQQALYRKARTYLERYREQRPQLAKRWAPLLYKVYLSLNEGKKFAEIEQLIAS